MKAWLKELWPPYRLKKQRTAEVALAAALEEYNRSVRDYNAAMMELAARRGGSFRFVSKVSELPRSAVGIRAQ